MRNGNRGLSQETPSIATQSSTDGNVVQNGCRAAANFCSTTGGGPNAVPSTGSALKGAATRAMPEATDVVLSPRAVAGVSPQANVVTRDSGVVTRRKGSIGSPANHVYDGAAMDNASVLLGQIPEGVRASAAPGRAEYNARRLRSQREVIRDVMLSAALCETWLTLGELRALTRYGEASISAQLRHLRRTENGGYEIVKRHRDGAAPIRPGMSQRAECLWEYRISPGVCAQDASQENAQQAVSA